MNLDQNAKTITLDPYKLSHETKFLSLGTLMHHPGLFHTDSTVKTKMRISCPVVAWFLAWNTICNKYPVLIVVCLLCILWCLCRHCIHYLLRLEWAALDIHFNAVSFSLILTSGLLPDWFQRTVRTHLLFQFCLVSTSCRFYWVTKLAAT